MRVRARLTDADIKGRSQAGRVKPRQRVDNSGASHNVEGSSGMDRKTGKTLAKTWYPEAKHALYRETGDWYHQLEEFPGVLFDKDGYVVFTESEFKESRELKINEATNTVTISGGIKTIPGYTPFDKSDQRPSAEKRKEGRPVTVILTRYERDPKARDECLEYYGSRSLCQVCKVDLKERYGDAAARIIHVHHLNPLGHARMQHAVDPKNDLLPVCPNCHSVIHARRPIPYTLDEIRELLNRSR